MAKIEFVVDVEDLTFDDMIDITEGKLRRAKEIMAKFVVGDDGKPMEPDAAQLALGQMNYKVMQETMARFAQLIAEATGATLPNGQGPK